MQDLIKYMLLLWLCFIIKRELEISELIKEENIDLLFLTETDCHIDTECEYKISGFNTVLPLRDNQTDQIRIIALVRSSLANTVKVKSEFMSKTFPSIWFMISELNKESTYIAGFYRQWNYILLNCHPPMVIFI